MSYGTQHVPFGSQSQFFQTSPELQECIEHCMSAHKACEQQIIACLMKGGVHAEAIHIRTLMDCSQICRVTADFMLRHSNLMSQIGAMCAQACVLCAEDCRQMADDDMMRACADICEKAAASCQGVSAHH